MPSKITLISSIIEKHLGKSHKWEIIDSKQLTQTVAQTEMTEGKIFFYRKWLVMLTLAELRKIVLHEVAHAICSKQETLHYAHGNEWRVACTMIGGDPDWYPVLKTNKKV